MFERFSLRAYSERYSITKKALKYLGPNARRYYTAHDGRTRGAHGVPLFAVTFYRYLRARRGAEPSKTKITSFLFGPFLLYFFISLIGLLNRRPGTIGCILITARYTVRPAVAIHDWTSLRCCAERAERRRDRASYIIILHYVMLSRTPGASTGLIYFCFLNFNIIYSSSRVVRFFPTFFVFFVFRYRSETRAQPVSLSTRTALVLSRAGFSVLRVRRGPGGS